MLGEFSKLLTINLQLEYLGKPIIFLFDAAVYSDRVNLKVVSSLS
jgi:hypothetical protein